jgi:hypothetical protein
MASSLDRSLLALGCVLLAACGSREATGTPVVAMLEHRLGGAPLVLDQAQDPASVTVSRLSYYLGQFRLRREDGTWIDSARRATPEGDYVRIDLAQPASLHFETVRAPPGAYRALEFQVGIDAQRNHAGAQTGALDPEHGLFWTWRTGYIFFALEGRSPASGAPNGALTYHLGGDDRLARTVTLPLELLVAPEATRTTLRVRVELDEFFRGLALDRTHTVMSPEGAAPLADRYAALFTAS